MSKGSSALRAIYVLGYVSLAVAVARASTQSAVFSNPTQAGFDTWHLVAFFAVIHKIQAVVAALIAVVVIVFLLSISRFTVSKMHNKPLNAITPKDGTRHSDNVGCKRTPLNTTFLVDLRTMRIAALFSILLTSIPVVASAAPVELARFEGGWGFVSSDPEDSWWGAGLRGGAGECGAPKQLRISIREETSPDGLREVLLRFHPNQITGAVVTNISDVRLTTEFLGETSVFEVRQDGRLVITQSGMSLLFKRC